MKTTLDLPDDLFRKTKATAALRGESLRDFVVSAIRAHLSDKSKAGWRAVFGKASKKAVADVDAILAAEFSRVDPNDWK